MANINKFVEQIIQSASDVAQAEDLSSEDIQEIFNQLPDVYRKNNQTSDGLIIELVNKQQELIAGDLVKNRAAIEELSKEINAQGKYLEYTPAPEPEASNPNEQRITALTERYNELIQTGNPLKNQSALSAIKAELKELENG